MDTEAEQSGKCVIRILHVTKELGSGGIESVICNLYHNIDREKIQFDFAMHYDEKGIHEDEVLGLGARVYRFRNLMECGSIGRYKSQWDHFFKTVGKEYQIVHLHYMSHEGMIAEVAKKYGKKVIAHSHSTTPSGFKLKKAVEKMLNRNLVRNSDVLLACSKQAGIDFFGEKFKKGGIVLKNAIDVEKYTFNSDIRGQMRRKNHLEGKVVIGHVGNYTYHKNQDFMLSIVSEAVKKNPDAVFIWCGCIKDHDLEHVKQLIREHHLEDHIVLAGRCNCVEKWMQAFDVFLFPSIYEGLGVVLIEAQACGLPCVVSDTIPEEAAVTKLMSRCKLTDTPARWAAELTNAYNSTTREVHQEEIAANGYDVRTTAEYLERLYQKTGGVYNHKKGGN